MHEFSLAQGLFNQLLQLAEKHQAGRIISAQVEIGRLSGIVVDSFTFGFEVLSRENKLTRTTVLDITETEPDYRCIDCGTLSPVKNSGMRSCPMCGSSRHVMIGGDDLILIQVEME